MEMTQGSGTNIPQDQGKVSVSAYESLTGKEIDIKQKVSFCVRLSRLKMYIKYNWWKRDLRKLYYKCVHNIDTYGFGTTMLPNLGKGKYVSVYRKGNIIDIVSEKEKGKFIRLIPYQPNHGIMVEGWKDGNMQFRSLLGLEQFFKSIIYASNVEELSGKFGTFGEAIENLKN